MRGWRGGEGWGVEGWGVEGWGGGWRGGWGGGVEGWFGTILQESTVKTPMFCHPAARHPFQQKRRNKQARTTSLGFGIEGLGHPGMYIPMLDLPFTTVQLPPKAVAHVVGRQFSEASAPTL